MKLITTRQLTKVKQIEKELDVDLQTNEMSEFEAHIVIQSYNGQQKQVKQVPGSSSSFNSSSELKTSPDNADISIQKVNLTEEEKELYDY